MRAMKDSGVEWIGEIPVDWTVSPLKYFLKLNDGGIWGNEPTGTSIDKIVIRSTEQTVDGQWDIVSPAKRDLSSLNYQGLEIQKDDLLITKSSGSDKHIGKTTLAGDYFSTHECYYSNFIQRLRTKNICPKFVWYLLNSPLVREQFVFLQNSTSGLGNINGGIIRSVIIPIPQISKQKQIIEFLDKACAKIDASIEKEKESIARLEEYKQSVITEAVTRGLDPTAPMKDSGIEWIGSIPIRWHLSKIGSLYEERNIKVSDKDFFPLSVTKKGILPQLETAAKTDNGDNRKLIRKNDFVINSRSDRRGSCGISELDGSCSLINIVLAPRQNMCNSYYNFVFHTEQFADEFYKWGNGIVDDLWSTKWSQMKRIYIPVPPLNEQQKISSYLDETCGAIDRLIFRKQSVIAKLTEYKKSLIYEAVTGKREV